MDAKGEKAFFRCSKDVLSFGWSKTEPMVRRVAAEMNQSAFSRRSAGKD